MNIGLFTTVHGASVLTRDVAFATCLSDLLCLYSQLLAMAPYHEV